MQFIFVSEDLRLVNIDPDKIDAIFTLSSSRTNYDVQSNLVQLITIGLKPLDHVLLKEFINQQRAAQQGQLEFLQRQLEFLQRQFGVLNNRVMGTR